MEVSGTCIAMVRGDDDAIKVLVSGYDLVDDVDVIELKVQKQFVDEVVIEKKATKFTDNSALITFASEDTSSLQYGTYRYNVRLTYNGGATKTIIGESEFKIGKRLYASENSCGSDCNTGCSTDDGNICAMVCNATPVIIVDIQGSGPQGIPGVSPIITISSIKGGTKVTITDIDGTKSFDILNGQDGFSPTVKTEALPDGTRVTITDKDSEKSFDVENGKDGAPGKDGVPGKDGTSAVISGASASVGEGTGTPTVDVKMGGTPQDRTFAFTFDNLKGKDGFGIPVPTPQDTGKVPIVNPDGTGYELGSVAVDAYTKAESDARYMPLVAAIRPVVSGELINVKDSAEFPLQDLKIFGKTTQDGEPSPDNPVPMVSVGDGGSVELTVIEENFVDIKPFDVIRIPSSSGYTLLSDENRDKVLSLPNGTYSVSYTVTGGNSAGTDLGKIAFQRDSEFLVRPTTTFQLSDDLKSKANRVVVYGNIGDNISFSNFMIVSGSKPSKKYAEYKVQPITIPTPDGLHGIPVDSGGNYTDSTGQQWICDSIERNASGGWEVVRRTEKYIPTGAEKVDKIVMLDGYERYSFRVSSGGIAIKNEKTQKSSRFLSSNKLQATNNTVNNTFYILGQPNGNLFLMRMDSILSTDGIKEYFRENVCEFLFAIEAPVHAPITDPDLIAKLNALHTYYGITNLFCTDNAGQQMQYLADTKLYIDNKLAPMTQALLGGI